MLSFNRLYLDSNTSLCIKMDSLHVSHFSSKVFIGVAVLILFPTLVDADLVRSSKIRTYKILEKDNLLVICNVTDHPDIEVYWTKNDTKSSFKQEGKRLEILNIKRSFSGDYICHALNTSFPVPEYNETDANVTVQVINVDVQYPAEIDFFSISTYEVVENETFTITCDFQAHPNPVWSIRNRDTGLGFLAATLPAKATMTSPAARCEYMGFWGCTGRNVLNNGRNVTRGHNVTVYCPPRPQFAKNQYVVKARVGEKTELTMYLQAYPKATYKWERDDGASISNVAVQDDFADVTRLTFPDMSLPYFGNYTLKMQNDYGTYFARYQIIPDGAPEMPTNLNYSDVTYNSVKLRWTSGFDMGSRQHFIIMKLYGNTFEQISDRIYDHSANHGINQNWTYVLTGLASDTTYNLTVVSKNERGFIFAKPSIVFRTQKFPHTYKSSKTDIRLILGVLFGSIATIAILALIVYVIKYRRLRTSYITVNEKSGLNNLSVPRK